MQIMSFLKGVDDLSTLQREYTDVFKINFYIYLYPVIIQHLKYFYYQRSIQQKKISSKSNFTLM